MTNYVTVWNEVEHSSEFLENPKEIFLWYYMDSDATNYVEQGASFQMGRNEKKRETYFLSHLLQQTMKDWP